MNTDTAYLALYLDAPLQSWGYQSRFDRRTTFSQPTRSGIIGMICAAMGIPREDTVQLDRFTDLRMTVITFQQQGRLMDFHTVGGGWEKEDAPGCIVKTADGKPGNTVVTHREYLQDARFGVILTGPRRQLGAILEALRNPRWGVWLGRKSCIPASPIAQGIFESEAAAREHLQQLHPDQKPIRTLTEVDGFENGTDTLMDVPVNFATREFAPRRIAVE